MSDTGRRATRCVDNGEMAAFIDGRLDADARARVEQHVAECEDCYELMTETTRALAHAAEAPAQVAASAAAPPPRRRTWWYAGGLAVAASIVAFLVAPEFLSRARGSRPEVAELIAAVGPQRPLESRLAGFAYGPVPSATRAGEPTTDSRPEIQIAVAHLEQKLQESRTPLNLAAYGTGAVAIGRLDAGIQALEEAVALGPTAIAWNDLGAAYLARGRRQDRAVDLPRAVEAVRTALSLDPALREAQFNLAMALETLHLRQEAIAAWTKYLELDSDSGWAAEARRRLEGLRRVADAAGDWLQQARDRLFDKVLVGWASTEQGAAADAALREAGNLATEISTKSPDRMATDTVLAIQNTAGDTALRQGHAVYGEARDQYRRLQFAVARERFARAAALLNEGKSPLAYLARFWEAASRFQLGDVQGARSRLAELADGVRAQPFPSVLGRCEWTLGTIDVGLGNHHSGASNYAAALASLRDAGETNSEAFVRQLIAENMNTLGHQAESWNLRIPALAVDSRNGALLSAAQAARQVGWLGASTAFLDEAIRTARASGRQIELADSLRARAIVSARLQQYDSAEGDLDEARRIATKDSAGWERLSAEIDAAEVHATRPTLAARGISAGTRAIDYFTARGLRHRLPALLGARARLHQSLGNTLGAEADLLEGLRLLEVERQSVRNRALRASYGDDLRRLTDELAAIKLQRGETDEAFNAIERTRSADLTLTATGRAAVVSLRELRAALRPGMTVAYFHVGNTHIHTWVIAPDRNHLVSAPVHGPELEALVRAFSADPSSEARVRLRALILNPIARFVPAGEVLAVVPDGALSVLAFGALPGLSHAFLIEEHAVLIAPSATWLVQSSNRPPAGAASVTQVTAIGNPRINRSTFPDLRDLPSAREEADRVARQYARATVLTGEQATRAAVLSRLPASDVLHFAGHAVLNDTRPFESQLVVWDPAGQPLTADDLSQLRLPRTRLVVLAACSSANGMLTRSEGAIGFARTLMAAGVPSVVASYWPVDDRASLELFSRFHERFATTGDAVRALHDAQLALLHSADAALRLPKAWGGYVAIGGMVSAMNQLL